MELFPESLRKLWNKWEIRALVLTSLYLQIILVFAGILRKRNTHKLVTAALWLAYLLADWVATLGLGVLSNNQGDSDCKGSKGQNSLQQIETNNLHAFWSPFLLLHLGGPDTITALALEDNELWLRHGLALLFQVVVVIYVIIRAAPISRLWTPTVLVFIAGCTKYGERTWALRYASKEHFRDSLLTKPDAGPNFAKFMDEYTSKREGGLQVEIKIQKEPESHRPVGTKEEQIEEKDLLSESHRFFQMFKRLVVDLMLTFHDRNESRAFFLKRTPIQAFKVIEVELAFLYEVLYTKAAVIHSHPGLVLRCMTFPLIFSSLVFFAFVKKHGYEGTDVAITYVLLVGALFLETYSICLMVFSDWTVVRMTNRKWVRAAKLVLRGIYFFLPADEPRWSNTMAQYNLLKCSLNEQWEIVRKLKKWFGYHDITRVRIEDDLKKFIFKELKDKSESCTDSSSYKRFSMCRGEWALQRKGYKGELGWSVQVELDESILLWHIATDLCYYHKEDKENYVPDKENYVPPPTIDWSRYISEYLVYILMYRPFMLTAGIGQIRFGDSCEEAMNFFLQFKRNSDIDEACKLLMEVETNAPVTHMDVKGEVETNDYVTPMDVKGDRSKSVLFKACKLAKELLTLKVETRWSLISHVWVEILSYASSQCRGNYHAQRLSKGGELLTHMWLLMAHLGIGDQYKIEQGHARAKLIVKT